jgi:hypothetical protein
MIRQPLESSYFRIFFCSVLVFLNSCQSDQQPYEPCSTPAQLGNFRPAYQSLDWIPFSDQQEILFTNESGDQLIIKLFKNNVLSEIIPMQFKLKCTEDSLKQRIVLYNTFKFQNSFEVIQGNSILKLIDLNVSVILDEQKSTLDNPHLADVLEFTLYDPQATTVLEFPILDRGYRDVLENNFIFNDEIYLGKKLFSEVYSNLPNGRELDIYYSMEGLLAIGIRGSLYVKNN